MNSFCELRTTLWGANAYQSRVKEYSLREITIKRIKRTTPLALGILIFLPGYKIITGSHRYKTLNI